MVLLKHSISVFLLIVRIDISLGKTFSVIKSRTQSFAMDQNDSQNECDVNLIENFAKKIEHDVKYIVVNETGMSEIVATVKSFEDVYLKLTQP